MREIFVESVKAHIGRSPHVAACTEAVYWDADKGACIVEPIDSSFTKLVRDHVEDGGFRIRSCVVGMQVVGP